MFCGSCGYVMPTNVMMASGAMSLACPNCTAVDWRSVTPPLTSGRPRLSWLDDPAGAVTPAPPRENPFYTGKAD